MNSDLEFNDRIIRINSCGPFPHGHYEVDGMPLSHEGPLKGRADLLVDTAIRQLEELCREDGLVREDVSILDVGAYDGWVANRLWHAGYRNITALEPREQNVSRGIRLRELLGIADGVHHLVGDLSSVPEPPGSPFDVVMSFGVVHHLNDIVGFLRSVRGLCAQALLLEGLTLPDSLVTPELTLAIEPKDIAYRSKDSLVSQIGVKLESAYYPGSAADGGVVFIPGRRALVWMIESAGFEVCYVQDGWGTHAGRQELAHREHAEATIIAARPVESPVLDFTQQVHDSEFEFCSESLPPTVLAQVARAVRANPDALNPGTTKVLQNMALEFDAPLSEIIRSIPHAPMTKLQLEQAKYHLVHYRPHEAIETLLSIVNVPSDDWRSVYRAFALLAVVDSGRAEYWSERLREANPEFPLEVLNRLRSALAVR